MIEQLKNLLNNAQAPYSKFKVSAIVVMKDNQQFKGVNVETLSFGGTICAERVAICNAITNGYKKGDFKEIHIMNSSDDVAMPCMICREMFVNYFEEDTLIYVYDKKGNKYCYTMLQLCPNPFRSNL